MRSIHASKGLEKTLANPNELLFAMCNEMLVMCAQVSRCSRRLAHTFAFVARKCARRHRRTRSLFAANAANHSISPSASRARSAVFLQQNIDTALQVATLRHTESSERAQPVRAAHVSAYVCVCVCVCVYSFVLSRLSYVPFCYFRLPVRAFGAPLTGAKVTVSCALLLADLNSCSPVECLRQLARLDAFRIVRVSKLCEHSRSHN